MSSVLEGYGKLFLENKLPCLLRHFYFVLSFVGSFSFIITLGIYKKKKYQQIMVFIIKL